MTENNSQTTSNAEDSHTATEAKEYLSLNDIQNEATQLHDWRLYLVIVQIGLGVFLVQLETTIVSTSLVSITANLSGLQDVSWIVTAYLITYSGCLTILSKLSDIFGRKPLITVSFIFYIALSIGCGFSQSIPALIITRAFQGIGAGGIFALSYVLLPEVVPPRLYSAFAAYLGGIAAIASLLGPLLGGTISNQSQSSWRWVFWLNGPFGGLALCLALLGLPNNYPFHNNHLRSSSGQHQARSQSLSQKIQRIDFVGAFFLLGASVLLIAGLEEGATKYSWTSALPPTTVVVSILLWSCFILWSKFLNQRQTVVESVFPWSLMIDRFVMGALISTFFSGAVFIALTISIPQRFQLIHGSSPFLSGVYLLPFSFSAPVGAISSGVFITRFRIPPLYIMLASALLQLIGLALMGGQSIRNGIPAAVYGLQVLTGFGLGLNLTNSTLLIPMVVSKKHQAIAMGSIGQLRNLGSSVALAIIANVLNSLVQDRLSTSLTPSQLDAVLEHPDSVTLLPIQMQDQVKDAYEDAYELQLRVLLAFSCASVLATCLIFEKRPRHQNEKGELV